MAARPMASATISFGLVSIPIKLYTTVESSRSIQFNRLHNKCNGRMKQQYYCPTDDEVVENDAMIKGYEFAKGQYVVFNDDELKALDVKSTETIDITEFVHLDQVDPIYYEKAYYLGPNKGGERPYKLLASTMRELNRSAVAKYAARGKQYLVLLRPFGEGIIMQQLHHHEDLKSFAEVPIGDLEVKDAERALARQLVEQITSAEFHPENYRDEVLDKMHELIQQKVEGKEIAVPPTEEPKAQIIDLMEALKASLGQAKSAGNEERKGPKRVESSSDKKRASGS